MTNIYFMRRADGIGPVKIGCTKWPEDRLYAMQIWSAYKLDILTTCPGSFRDEKHIHRTFRVYRMEGEWFAAVPCIMALVDAIRRSGQLPDGFHAPPPQPSRRTPPNPHGAEIVARARQGECYARIAADYGITRQRAFQIADAGGIARRRRAA